MGNDTPAVRRAHIATLQGMKAMCLYFGFMFALLAALAIGIAIIEHRADLAVIAAACTLLAGVLFSELRKLLKE